MQKLVRDGEIVEDGTQHLGDDDPLPDAGPFTVSLARWKRDHERLGVRPGVGVRLGPADDPAAIADDVRDLGLVVLDIPTFRDGRYFSSARILRSRFGFRGELRARGDVLPDQMFYMHRCGINGFEVRADRDLETAVAALRSFSVTYQGAEDQALPLYRRRLG